MPIPIGILDQSPIVSGASGRDAVEATIELARSADRWGYARYWLAEHHSLPGLADASPEVLLARLTAETSRIRLGTGGIMLPHYSAFKVAETFRMLEALAPGRIDLGLGRAPGGAPIVGAALETRDPAEFPQQIRRAIGYLEGSTPPGPFERLKAVPVGETAPEVWILGSSDYGAILAAKLGLPYAYAQFIGGEDAHIPRVYRHRFQPSDRVARPRCIVAVASLAATTREEAEDLVAPLRLWRARVARGELGPIPSLEEARRAPLSPVERHRADAERRIVYGTPDDVRVALERIAEECEADELMIVTIAPDYSSRLRSYELLAEAFGLASRDTSGPVGAHH